MGRSAYDGGGGTDRRTDGGWGELDHGARRVARADTPPPVVAVPLTPALTDAGWALVAPLLATAPGRTGRPPRDHRAVVAGILWVLRHGASWREIPAAYGPWSTHASRYRRWRCDGTWARIVALLAAVGPG